MGVENGAGISPTADGPEGIGFRWPFQGGVRKARSACPVAVPIRRIAGRSSRAMQSHRAERAGAPPDQRTPAGTVVASGAFSCGGQRDFRWFLAQRAQHIGSGIYGVCPVFPADLIPAVYSHTYRWLLGFRCLRCYIPRTTEREKSQLPRTAPTDPAHSPSGQ